MACFWLNQNEAKIEIPSVDEVANVTFYKVAVFIGEYKWSVHHRYSEFYDLHLRLVEDHGVSKDILPSKKVIRNKCPVFIETRRKGLEEYLQKVFMFLKRTMPKIFVDFLNFNVYDIFFLLQDLSSKCFVEADHILSSKKPYSFEVLELHAISEYLKQPFPAVDNMESRFDLSPVLDLCSQINNVNISGNTSNYLHSNIILNKLPFELSSFKILKVLDMRNVALDMLFSLGNLRTTLNQLQVHYTNITSICEILQCDVIHKYNLEGSEKWTNLETIDLSNNNLTEIDSTISLVPNLKTLILNDNKISTISDITALSKLSHLSLCNNLITSCSDLHMKLGKISTLNLSQNGIVTCQDFSKLYSLESLDLSCNKIMETEEIKCIGELPCLENFVLTGNNVATTVDYRVKVLEFFGERAVYVCLDNEKPSQAELDKASVLRALRIVKEGKTPYLNSFNQ